MGVRNIARLQVDPEHRLADRRLGRPGRRRRPSPDARPGQVRDRHDHHLGGQPGLAVLHGQPAALPRPQQHRRQRAHRLVRLRQPEEHLAAQHRPGGPAAGPGQHDLVLARRRRPGLPAADDGSGCPTYEKADADLHPAVPPRRRPGRSCPARPTTAPQVDTDSGVAWPSYWDEQVVHRRPVQRQQPRRRHRRPGHGRGRRARRPSPRTCGTSSAGGNGDNQLQSWMDAKFGPDGALYLLDYAGGFFSLHPNQKLIRVTYQGGPATPGPERPPGGRPCSTSR